MNMNYLLNGNIRVAHTHPICCVEYFGINSKSCSFVDEIEYERIMHVALSARVHTLPELFHMSAQNVLNAF